MLSHITIKGFKSVASIERLELKPINVLIGPNGAGKSNFIEAFTFLHAVCAQRLQNFVAWSGGAERLLHFGSKVTRGMEFDLSFEDGRNGYALRLLPSQADTLVCDEERVSFWDKAGGHGEPYTTSINPSGPGLEAQIAESRRPIARYVRNHLRSWRVYHFHDTSHSSPMRKAARIDDNRLLRADGSNLAAFLYLLQEQHPDHYQEIRNVIRQVTPFFDDFRLQPLALSPENIKLEWTHTDSDQYFDASALSDGTLRFIALATTLMQPVTYRPSTLIIDEPELGLHPAALRLLAAMLRRSVASDNVTGSPQVVLSTQSAQLLDEFSPEEVLIVERASGGTVIQRLDPGSLSEWLEDYSLGQLWEKNELGARPVRG